GATQLISPSLVSIVLTKTPSTHSLSCRKSGGMVPPVSVLPSQAMEKTPSFEVTIGCDGTGGGTASVGVVNQVDADQSEGMPSSVTALTWISYSSPISRSSRAISVRLVAAIARQG